MIELHRLTNEELSGEIEDKLREMVVAFRTVVHEPEESTIHRLPFIREGNRIVSGEQQLKEFLYELEDELGYQRSISGDSCYIDPKTGKVC